MLASHANISYSKPVLGVHNGQWGLFGPIFSMRPMNCTIPATVIPIIEIWNVVKDSYHQEIPLQAVKNKREGTSSSHTPYTDSIILLIDHIQVYEVAPTC